jgi:triosephosphate isomerase
VAALITPLIAGNWKMNGLSASLAEAEKLAGLLSAGARTNADVVLCPPATLLAAMSARLAGSAVLTGGQDCHPMPDGPHTGDISGPMLADAGARYVILGHSERRIDHGESNDLVHTKVLRAFRSGLVPIICVGETRIEREAGDAEGVVSRQLAGSVPDAAAREVFVIAYEPVWAIGTGLVPTADDIEAIHRTLRRLLRSRFGDHGAGIRILYGGSVKPGNAREILAIPDVNGALVGGASLLASDFFAIISALS